MADIIDINVYETVETVTINAQPNLTTINVNSVTSAPQVNSDWNATSGVEEILNKPTIPTQTSQLTNNGADGTNPFITALDIPTAGQAGTLVREVKNMTGATLTKGTVVYISGANGNKPLVSKALATTDALSSRTFGLLQSSISNNGLGYCVIIGDLSGLDTSAFTEGAQLYLSGVTAGTYTDAKILAPTHLVYVGKVTRSHPTQGQIEVGIQNGYELEEIHDVAISSVADKQLLSYDVATDLWKNKSVTTADIADSTNKRYQTDNQQSYNDATSSIQTQLNSKGTFTLPSLTSGSVLFSNGTTIAQDNANLFWDNTNKRLNIGGITSNTSQFGIKAQGGGSSNIALRVRNTADSLDLLTMAGDGTLFVRALIKLGGNTDNISASSNSGFLDINTNTGIKMNPGSAFSTLFHTTGNVLIGTTVNNGGKLQIKAGGALSTDIALRVRNSADTADLATIGGTGILTVGGTGNDGTINLARGSNGGIMGAIIQTSTFTKFINYQGSGFDFFVDAATSTQRAFIRGTGVGISGTTGGTFTLDASALLQGDSTTQGFLPPRMTTTQKNAIASPASGLVVYDTTLGKLCVRGASAWETITSI